MIFKMQGHIDSIATSLKDIQCLDVIQSGGRDDADTKIAVCTLAMNISRSLESVAKQIQVDCGKALGQYGVAKANGLKAD